MKKFTKVCTLAMTLVLSLSLLAGCSGGKDDTTTQAPSSSQTGSDKNEKPQATKPQQKPQETKPQQKPQETKPVETKPEATKPQASVPGTTAPSADATTGK